MTLSELIIKQNNKCHYCNCEMHSDIKHPQRATTEHLIDKWSSPKHNKIESESNLAAACWQCNNSRGSIRNKIARAYYKGEASKKKIKLNVPSTSSKQLYSMFGPVPQHLFV